LPEDNGDARSAEEKAQEEFQDKLNGIVARLEKEADDRVAKRQSIENRWIEDLRQYHGNTDDLGTTKDESKARPTAKKEARSTLNINLTRSKTNAFAARLTDLLFPTDDRNWGIQPTPVPELVEKAKKAAEQAQNAKDRADQASQQAGDAQQSGDPNAPALAATADKAQRFADAFDAAAKRHQAVIDEARKCADRMADEIDDQLTECQYAAQARDAIEDASKLGTGIIKGPQVGDRVRDRWTKKDITDPNTGQVVGSEYAMEQSPDPKPRMTRVDPWSFFPDPDVRTVAESEGVYERHLLNRKGMRKLARTPGFNKDAIATLLRNGNKPRGALPTYLSDLRTLTGDNQASDDERFIVWEYTGPLECEDIKCLAEAAGDQATVADYEEEDPLLEINACVWFCDGELLKFAIYPLDSGEPIYSVFCLEKDEASIFGYGIPYIMRHPQKALGAAWRMMLDNGGLSVGPQIVIDKEKIEPMDGDWVLRPRKIWWANDGIPKDEHPFRTYNIEMHQAELAGIIALAKQHIDDETSMPQIAQGEQGSGVTKTAQGMAILMNSTNVVFRRVVKNFDDDMTVPNIRRLYDWNMQFSSKDEIKGDFQTDARGSSVLLVREMQAQNLMILAMQFGAHPVYGVMLKNPEVLRAIFRAHMLKASEYVLDDDAIEKAQAKLAEIQAQQQQAGQPQQAARGKTPEELQLMQHQIDAEVEIANQDAATRRYVADKNHEAAMTSLAEKLNMTTDELNAKLHMKAIETGSKERMFAGEAAMRMRTGVSAGGSV
jgi:hypothetical protein